MYASPESIGCAYQLTAGETFECRGIDGTFNEPKRANFENDSFRNLSYFNKIDNQMNTYRQQRYQIPEEERETTQWNGIDRNRFASNELVLQKPFYDKAKMTHRQTRQSRRNGNLSNPEREMGAHSFQQQFTNVRPTHKESAKLIDYKGIASSLDHGLHQDRNQYLNATYNGLKEDTLNSYIPGPSKNYYSNGANDTFLTIKNQLSNEENIHPLMPSVPFQTIRDKSSDGLFTSICRGDMISEYNELLDLSIALPQLSSNPFALTPFSTKPGI